MALGHLGADSLLGGGGNDILRALTGDALVDGGADQDTLALTETSVALVDETIGARSWVR